MSLFFYHLLSRNHLLQLQVSIGETYSLALHLIYLPFCGPSLKLLSWIFWVFFVSHKPYVSSSPLKQAFLFDQLFTAPDFPPTEGANHHKSGRALGIVFNPFGCVQLHKLKLIFPFMLSCENASKSIYFLSWLQCCFPQPTKGLGGKAAFIPRVWKPQFPEDPLASCTCRHSCFIVGTAGAQRDEEPRCSRGQFCAQTQGWIVKLD